MEIFNQISKSIMDAMKAKDKIRLEALRGAKKEFIEANTKIGGGQILDDNEAIKILQKMVKQRNDSAEIYKSQNREDLMNKELEEAKVLQEYLPKQLSTEELENKISEIIREVGATNLADLGKVMGIASKNLMGLAPGKAISETVKKLLSK